MTVVDIPTVNETTIERLDPMSAAAARPVTIGAAVIALALPVVVLVTRGYEITNAAWFALSYAAVIVAAIILLVDSRPNRPVWRAPSAQFLQISLVVSALASAASTAGANDLLRDDWPPLAIGLFLIAITPYRPAREIAAWAGAHTLVSAVLGAVQATAGASDMPRTIDAVTASVTVAILGFAAAAYAHSMIVSTQRWQQRAWTSAVAVVREERVGLARTVQQSRITLLNHRVVPFLQRIAATERLTDDEREEARRLAGGIRDVLVADVERGWAQQMLDDTLQRHPQLNIVAVADDPDDVGRQASLERRTLLRAIVAFAVDSLAATEVSLRLRAPDGRLSVECAIRSPLAIAQVLYELRSIIAVIRGLAQSLTVDEVDGRLVLRFAYGY